jgi:hypothetical protein
MNPSIRTGLALSLALAAGAALAQAQPAAPAPAPSNQAPAPAPESVESIFKRMDKNHDNVLSLDEFRAAIDERNRAIILTKLEAQFHSMDTNKSGFLDPTEFYQLEIVKNGGKDAPTFAGTDTDKDHKINFREYVAAIGKYAEARNAEAAKKP